MNLKSIFKLAVCITIIAIVGCSQSIDPEILAAREDLVMKAPPESTQTIAEAKSLASSATMVTLVGRIEAGDIDPFDQQIAAFMLSELPEEHEQNEGHDADNCPFCKRRAANAPKAHVTMIDESDSPILHAAPKLLGLKKGDQVIVQGTGTWNPDLNVLEVKSRGIYLSP